MNGHTSGRVVVGLDRARDDDVVLTAALSEAEHRRAALVVVHAVEITDWETEFVDPGYIRHRQAERTTQIATVRAALECRVGKRIAERGLDIPVTYQVRCGDPATCLLGAGRHADLIVIGTCGSTHRPPLLLGLVSQDVAVHATCPVLLVPTAAP